MGQIIALNSQQFETLKNDGQIVVDDKQIDYTNDNVYGIVDAIDDLDSEMF